MDKILVKDPFSKLENVEFFLKKGQIFVSARLG
jgi:hypothetical protein